MPWMPYEIVPKPEGREWCDNCSGTGHKRHRYGGDISDSDFSKCSPCFGLGLKPIPVDEMTEAQINEILLHVNYELFLSRKPTLEKKKEAVCELVKIWSI